MLELTDEQREELLVKNLERLRNGAEELITFAESIGYKINITEVSLQPLAMRNTEPKIEIWPKRS